MMRILVILKKLLENSCEMYLDLGCSSNEIHEDYFWGDLMISLYELKPKFQNFLRPVVRKLAMSGVTANQVTVAAMVLSLITGGLIYFFSQQMIIFILVPIVLFVRMALNAIDGMLAREHQMKSSLGQILNELGDVISDAALYLPFVRIPGIAAEFIVAIVVLSIISEMTGVLGSVIGGSRRYDGPMGKSDRALVFGIIALLFSVGITISSWGNWVLSVVILCILINIIQRVRKALKEVQ